MNLNESPNSTVQPPVSLDPYAPPSAQVGAPLFDTGLQAPLADRGSRLVAQIFNGLTMLPAIIPTMIFLFSSEGSSIGASSGFVIAAIISTIYLIGLLVVNLRLLARQGQSLGKKWANVRIVRTDGSPASLGRLIGLRYIVNTLIGAIPMVGSVYGIVNILFIFGQDRRCLHDMIADTKVVVA